MNVLRKLFPVLCDNIVSNGLYVLVIASVILMSPAINSLQNVRAAIDETMPDTIPAEVIADWKSQDGTDYAATIEKIKIEYPAIADKITSSGEDGYLQACHWRRVEKMKNYPEIENIMFARHYNFGGILVGFHDNSDKSNTCWKPSGGALCILKFNNYYPISKDLIARTEEVVRDPCISFDGTKVLFAISGKGAGTGYKIYEMEIADPTTLKQLTTAPEGLPPVADFEPCYLPNGDIMFSSTRNFASVSGEFLPSVNMFLMNGQGNFIRQVGFDQAHTFYPVLLDDGTVLYSRWEYNDRDFTNSMGLFIMNPDGTHQTEWFGNQTSWPLTMLHGRPVPNTNGMKVMCLGGGHHGPYTGELMMLDRSKGSNGTACMKMLAPVREAKPMVQKSDRAAGNVLFLFQNPLPLDEQNLVVSWRKSEAVKNYGLYFMDVNGNRELLAWADQSVSQPVLIKPRKTPPQPVVQTNYNDSMGTFTMQDVYAGDGMKGVTRGTAKSLRVVALQYRIAGSYGKFGQIMGSGPSGVFTPAICCPISAYGGSREAKEVLGEAKIYEDGSAAFKVPARTPVYFQVIDSMGYCIATMRSWSTLMPGETFSCFGCHFTKMEPVPSGTKPQANTPQKLDTPLGIENKPFDFDKMVQPVFDNNCVSCHMEDHESGFDLRGTLVTSAKRFWATSYNSLCKGVSVAASNRAINICTIFSQPEQQPPRSFGSYLSGIMNTGGMSGTHYDVQVTETERKIVACWIDLCVPYIGKYNGYMTESDSTAYEKLVDKRRQWAAIEKENINALLAEQTGSISDEYGKVKFTRTITERLRIGYIPAKHILVLNNPGQGNLIVVDLRGTVISRLKISDRRMDGIVSIPLPASLSKGVYVARFEGKKEIRQTTISITK